MGALMNRHNAKMNAFALEKLAPTSSDRVLEIGFGGGLTLPELISKAGHVTGLDRSRTAVDVANSRFAAAVSSGRVRFLQGNVEKMPFEDCSFGKVYTVNTVYFWPSLGAAFSEIYRVLVPGGRIVVGFLPKEHMDKMGFPTDIFTTRTVDEVAGAISGAGFSDLRITRPEPATKWNVMLATR